MVSGASRRSSEDLWLREALLSARRGPVVHRATSRVINHHPHSRLTDVTRLNFLEVARAAFFSKSEARARYEVARAGLVH